MTSRKLPAAVSLNSFAGCNELIFNPMVSWWRLGPISKQLRVFLWSEAPVHYKVSMMSCELWSLRPFLHHI